MSFVFGVLIFFAIGGMVESTTWVCEGETYEFSECEEHEYELTCKIIFIMFFVCLGLSSFGGSVGGGVYYFVKMRNAAGADLESDEENTKTCDSVELIV
ncbi:hypothetical protein M3Y94_00978400 [Aphelenchoides besseyi]|nr:hypothetical protein M3Y94_00978400 [Aphelenchoides besseyi]